MISVVIDFADREKKERLWKILKACKPVKYSIEIKQARDKRSVNQNAYYHACIVKPLADYIGYNEYEMHEELKLRFNPKVIVNKITGKSITIGGSTTEFDTKGFEDYAERIRIWAISELNFLIQLPNEYLEND